MRDNQHLMTEFVKIVEKYPEIYNHNLDGYRTRFSEIAWTKVASRVRTELNEECTADELKVKWKGIRSSFNRYKSKLYQSNDTNFCKKYYLYDHLRFLDPFVRYKGSPVREQTITDKSEETLNESTCNYVVSVENIDNVDDFNTIEEWNHIELKPDLNNRCDKSHEEPPRSNSSTTSKTKKRKSSYDDKDIIDDDNEDLQFFKSILPDIRNFTTREKRKLKMGILQLIDNLENERKAAEDSQ